MTAFSPKLTGTLFLLITGLSFTFSQTNDPLWDIGTKWTYEHLLLLGQGNYTVTYATNEIIDTTTLDGLKLYIVESQPTYTGIEYFYYEDGRVYNYDAQNKLLVLLYDFSETESYEVDYRPICDPIFEDSGLEFYTYTIEVENIEDMTMPDGSVRNLQTVSHDEYEVDTRTVLDKIGFFEGKIDATHNWVFGMSVCDNFSEQITTLRCFENDSISYNFKAYPCDSTFSITYTIENEIDVAVYPNPTMGSVELTNMNTDVPYEIYNTSGQLCQTGTYSPKGKLSITNKGINILRFRYDNQWHYKKIIKMETSY